MIDGYQRFEPDFYMAQSWRRLAFEPENIQEHDLMLANMFVDSCDIREYEYKFIKCNCKISKKDIVKYIESLYINEKRYVDDFGYDKFFGMN